MSKLVLPLVAALGVTVGLLLSGSPVRAMPPQPRTKWEYRVFRLDPMEYSDKADYLEIQRRYGPRAAESAFYEHVLRYLGKDGWELVSYERRNKQNLVYLYLKRPAAN